MYTYYVLRTRGVNFRKIIVTSYLTNHFKNYSTYHSKNYLLDPWFITGLFDAKGSFVITIIYNIRYKSGWFVQAIIQIKINEKDRALIKSIQDFFGGIGYVSKPNNTSRVEFRVSTLKDIINIIIPHFYNNPLITIKSSDYIFNKQVALLLLEK